MFALLENLQDKGEFDEGNSKNFEQFSWSQMTSRYIFLSHSNHGS